MFQVTNYVKWSILMFVLAFVTYETYSWSFNYEYDPWESILTFIISKTILSAFITGIIWACVTSNHCFVNRFLSCKFWAILSRLSYSVYPTHAWSIWLFMGSARDVIDKSLYSIVSL